MFLAVKCRSLRPLAARFSSVVKSSTKVPEDRIEKSVLVSQSTDIFDNLALEDWIYKNYDLSSHHVLMVWRNDPCVVVGRHQNAWLEANVPFLLANGIPLARRNSGGGAVYHDRGNLNLTFFTAKENYSRKYNLGLITRALYREYNVDANINERDDIVVKGKYKVSGTAAKLGRPSAYHHCTLLVNADKANLSRALAKNESGITTNATQSVRSPISNLRDENTRITVDGLQAAIGWEFLRTPALHLADGGLELISRQRGFQMVSPTEEWFPGIAALRSDLASWEWRFGKTPDFKIGRSFTVPASLLRPGSNSMDLFERDGQRQQLRIDMGVAKGLIVDVTLNVPPGLMSSGFHGDASVVTHLRGKKFTSEALVAMQDALQDLHLDGGEGHGSDADKKLGEKERFVAKCFDQVVNTV